MKVVIINGSGGSGKDTIVELLRTYFFDKYEIENISTIDKVKDIARQMGWNCEKDESGRQFLAALKDAWTCYNNGANQTVLDKVLKINIDEFRSPKEAIVFIHCREPEAIGWFVEKLVARNIDVCTMIVKREGIIKFFNEADKSVDNYNYDVTVLNNGTLEGLNRLCKDLSIYIENWDIKSKILV